MSGAWERNPLDILIATTISGQELVYYEVAEQRKRLRFPTGLKVMEQKFPEPVIDVSRDKAVQMAVQNGARWLFFYDSDLMVPEDTLERLILRDKPIVGGLYVRRHNPPFNEMLRFRTDGIPGLRPIQDGEFQMGDMVLADALATGCLLVRTDVFEKVRPFQMTIDGQPARPAFFLWTEWRLPAGMSEDFSFVSRAKQQGVEVWCDTSIQCKHVGPVRFLPSGTGKMNVEFMGTP